MGYDEEKLDAVVLALLGFEALEEENPTIGTFWAG